jgi:hypothetical protein
MPNAAAQLMVDPLLRDFFREQVKTGKNREG